MLLIFLTKTTSVRKNFRIEQKYSSDSKFMDRLANIRKIAAIF